MSSLTKGNSRKRDRFTVRPSDYISDSVTAPSSTAAVCSSTKTKLKKSDKKERGSTCWLCCWAADMLGGRSGPESRLGWGRVNVHRHLLDDIIAAEYTFPSLKWNIQGRKSVCLYLWWGLAVVGQVRRGRSCIDVTLTGRVDGSGVSCRRAAHCHMSKLWGEIFNLSSPEKGGQYTQTHTDACSGSLSDTYCWVWLWGSDR